MSNADFDGELKTLGEALRALPQVAPEHSAWPQIAARLAAQQRSQRMPSGHRGRRWFVPVALAAGVVLAAIAALPWQQSAQPGSSRPSALSPGVATVASPVASSNTNAANSTTSTNPQIANGDAGVERQLATLQQRSQDLEHWLRETRGSGGPLRGQDLAAATEIEDMIGLVDGQLNAAARDSELPLWRRRVALLEDLTVLRYSSYKVAETGVAQR